MRKVSTFFKEVRIEMAKVAWPTRRETTVATASVIGLSVAVAAYLALLDLLFVSILKAFLVQ